MREEALSYGDLVRVDIGIRLCRVNEYDLLCVIIVIRVVEFDGRKASQQVPQGHGSPR